MESREIPPPTTHSAAATPPTTTATATEMATATTTATTATSHESHDAAAADQGRKHQRQRQHLPPSDEYLRLNMPAVPRIFLTSGGAFALGMGLGIVEGGRMAQLRFRAEHAHKMPSTTADWYLYHKTKNYHAMFGGLREGTKMGGKLGFLALALVWVEHTLDVYRGRRDFLSTVMSSVAVSGGFSLWNRFPLTTTARTTKQALAFGLVYGGIQDALALIRGQPVGYVDFAKRWIMRRRKWDGASETKTTTTT